MKCKFYFCAVILLALSALPFIILGLLTNSIVPFWGAAVFLILAIIVYNDWKKTEELLTENTEGDL